MVVSNLESVVLSRDISGREIDVEISGVIPCKPGGTWF